MNRRCEPRGRRSEYQAPAPHRPGRSPAAAQTARVLVTGALFVWACGGVEAFHAGTDGGPSASGGATPASGGATSAGGAPASGSGGGPVATGGTPVGTGGRNTGGAGTGGRGTGGRGTGGRASGGADTGGRSSGGASAVGGRGTGGRFGGGDSGGRSSGGASAAGGRGTGGVAATGGRGTGGASAMGPCGGLCEDPVNVPPKTNSGALGTGATCHQVVGMVAGIVCGNFTAPRTFSVNGNTVSCNGSNITVPALRNGGYCMESTAGQTSSAYFTTY